MNRILILSFLLVLLWTGVCLLAPYTIWWWGTLFVCSWVIISVLIFLSMMWTSSVPNTWLVRLFFYPAMIVLGIR